VWDEGYGLSGSDQSAHPHGELSRAAADGFQAIQHGQVFNLWIAPRDLVVI
jgi:hypothetical protein